MKTVVCLLFLIVSLASAKISFTNLCKKAVSIESYTVYSVHEVRVVYKDDEGFFQTVIISKPQFNKLKKTIEEKKKNKENSFIQKEGKYIVEIKEVIFNNPDVTVICTKVLPNGERWEVTQTISMDAYKKLQKMVKNNTEKKTEEKK